MSLKVHLKYPELHGLHLNNWKVIAEQKDAGILDLWRTIQPGAKDEAGSLRAFV